MASEPWRAYLTAEEAAQVAGLSRKIAVVARQLAELKADRNRIEGCGRSREHYARNSSRPVKPGARKVLPHA